MKVKNKIKVTCVSLVILSVLNIFSYQIFNNSTSSNRFSEKNDSFVLKIANYWNLTGTPIYIDDTAVGTYDWATINATYDWCKGSGTKSDPYILENIIIDGLNTGNCIEIWYSSVYFIIKNCTIYNSGEWDCGMYLYDVYNAKIHNNTVHSNFEGIFFQGDGDYNNVTNNIVRDNGRTGIVFESFNDYCIIHNNTAINNNQHGIVLRQECINNTISNNFVKDHVYSGILIQGGSINNTIIENTAVRNAFAGIWVYNSDDNIFKRNNFSNNIGYGVEIEESNTNKLIENTIYNNTIYGIEFSSYVSNRAEKNKIINNNVSSNGMAGVHLDAYSMNNSIFLNNFIDNNINGYDEGTNNTNKWDNSIIGNYWDDYPGVDDNDDGIGDAPYADIGGTVGAQDNFPIWWDAPRFSIVSPLSSEQFGDVAPSYTLSLDGGYNDTMWYTLDNGITNQTFTALIGTINQSLWNNTAIGSVTIRFYMSDIRGFTSYKQVFIEKIRFETYWYLDPFVIDDTGGGDYTWMEAVSQDWCSGNGTLTDPYIIDYIRIDGQNSSNCLTIQNSNATFVISNSSFYYSSDGTFDGGIVLDHVMNGLIIDCNSSFNKGNGIVLSYCQYIIITRNSINSNNKSGIFLFYSDHNLIFNNVETINNNTINGILLLYSDYNNITNNIINNNAVGVYIQESNYNNITDNDLINNLIPYNLISGLENIIEDFSFPKGPGGKFPFEIILIILIIAISAIGITGSALIIKKRRSFAGVKKKEISEKKREKIRKKLETKLEFADYLIRERQIDLAYKNLGKIQDIADMYDFFDIFNKAIERVEQCKEIQGIAKPIISEEISKTEKRMKEETIVPPMITRDEEKKYNLFISYSTVDRDYFQIKKIVKELKKFPKINQVSYWERDSKANIVEFMDETLEVSNTFLLFCSENSIKSNAVKDEWQAAFQMRKQGLIKLIPIYEEQKHIPKILWHLLNVKYEKDNFKGFIENLYKEILRE
ncbi:MAG: right-handed parallel beta-helix repeat-containing protein [Promethearchaeota archaeon]